MNKKTTNLKTESTLPSGVETESFHGECLWSKIGNSWYKQRGCPDPSNYYCLEPVGLVNWEELDTRVHRTIALEEELGSGTKAFQDAWNANPNAYWPLDAIQRCWKDGKYVYVPHVQIIEQVVYPLAITPTRTRKTPCHPNSSRQSLLPLILNWVAGLSSLGVLALAFSAAFSQRGPEPQDSIRQITLFVLSIICCLSFLGIILIRKKKKGCGC